MTIARRFAAAFLLAIILAGCTLALPPATSASVDRFSNGRSVQSWKLTEPQLRLLSVWFAEHQSGWSHSYVTYVPAIYVHAVHVGGKPSTINILAPTLVVVNYDDRQIEQRFEAAVVQSLISIVGAPGG